VSVQGLIELNAVLADSDADSYANASLCASMLCSQLFQCSLCHDADEMAAILR
jgi:hypothetical protein